MGKSNTLYAENVYRSDCLGHSLLLEHGALAPLPWTLDTAYHCWNMVLWPHSHASWTQPTTAGTWCSGPTSMHLGHSLPLLELGCSGPTSISCIMDRTQPIAGTWCSGPTSMQNACWIQIITARTWCTLAPLPCTLKTHQFLPICKLCHDGCFG